LFATLHAAPALELSELWLEAGDRGAAERAACKGLLACPESPNLIDAREAARKATAGATPDLEEA
jgi:hypothetical protein